MGYSINCFPNWSYAELTRLSWASFDLVHVILIYDALITYKTHCHSKQLPIWADFFLSSTSIKQCTHIAIYTSNTKYGSTVIFNLVRSIIVVELTVCHSFRCILAAALIIQFVSRPCACCCIRFFLSMYFSSLFVLRM